MTIPSMTRKHFEFLALAFGKQVANATMTMTAVGAIAAELDGTNPAFDARRFIDRVTSVAKELVHVQ